MINEIKMCKLGRERIIDDIKITYSVDTWIPIFPQPSCENCGYSDETKDHLLHVRCNHPLISMLMPRNFYCKYWKVKE